MTPRGCAVRIAVVIAILAGALFWFSESSFRKVAEEVKRCDDEATSAVTDSSERVTTLSRTISDFEKAKGEIEPTLKAIEDLRSSNQGIYKVFSAEVKGGSCRLELRPVLKLLETEGKAGRQGAEYVSLLIRAEQSRREAELNAKEARDYAARYKRLGQAHLLRSARVFSIKAKRASANARQLSTEARRQRGLYQSALDEHKDIASKIG